VYQDGVTIAIPNWNHEFFLPRSIRAALEAVRHLRADAHRAEVLVVDDSSRDGSRTLLRWLEALYRGDGLRVHHHESNAGLAAARNSALLHARYRYIVFMDADNEIVGANLPLFLRSIQETRAAAAYGNLLIRQAGRGLAHALVSYDSFQNRIFDMNFIDAFALFDRLQLLDVGGYCSALVAHEDWELWMHLATAGRRIVFVPLAFGFYHELPDSMIRTERDGHKVHARAKRIFNQAGFRNHSPTNARHLRYFPGIGYL
jgi:glycosyltransferase involved in cell wall biosynthesis